MPDFPIHTIESAPQSSRRLLNGLKEQLGFIPNLAATMAHSPTLLEAFLSLRAVVAAGTLDAVAREIVAIAVASETACSYCGLRPRRARHEAEEGGRSWTDVG